MTAPDILTRVQLIWFEKRLEHWIRFGRPVAEQILDRRRRILSFAPDSPFAYVRWASNDYGTAVSRIDIVRAVAPGDAFSTIPFVQPGGQILLRLSGWAKVEQALQAIDAVERADFDPSDACPDHWRHVQLRIAAGQAARPYTRERHHAWVLRRRLHA